LAQTHRHRTGYQRLWPELRPRSNEQSKLDRNFGSIRLAHPDPGAPLRHEKVANCSGAKQTNTHTGLERAHGSRGRLQLPLHCATVQSSKINNTRPKLAFFPAVSWATTRRARPSRPSHPLVPSRGCAAAMGRGGNRWCKMHSSFGRLRLPPLRIPTFPSTPLLDRDDIRRSEPAIALPFPRRSPILLGEDQLTPKRMFIPNRRFFVHDLA